MTDQYLAASLPAQLPDNPMHWAEAWLAAATDNAVQRNPNSMTLVTVDAEQQPSARIVLCKAFVADPGYIVFYTNYQSRKIIELSSNPKTAATFHWDAMGRQVRLEGLAVRSPASESDAYFASRHWGSQIGAWGSDQSAEVESRDALKLQVRERAKRFGVRVSEDLQSLVGDDHDEPRVPRPPHWGGIRLWPQRVELWIEGADRVHDRALWQRGLTNPSEHEFDTGAWSGTRLQP